MKPMKLLSTGCWLEQIQGIVWNLRMEEFHTFSSCQNSKTTFGAFFTFLGDLKSVWFTDQVAAINFALANKRAFGHMQVIQRVPVGYSGQTEFFDHTLTSN